MAQAEIRDFPLERGPGPFTPPLVYEHLRKEEPASRVRLWDGSEVWYFTRYDDVLTVLTDKRFSQRPELPGYPFTRPAMKAWRGGGHHFVHMDDPEHTQQRRMFTRELTGAGLRQLEPMVQRLVDEALAAMVAKPAPADLVVEFAYPIPSRVICELLGVAYEDHEFFETRSLAALSTSPEQAAAAMKDLLDYFAELIERRKASPGDDLLSRVVVDHVLTGELEADVLADIARLLLVAGHETTANSISLGALAFLQHPDQLAPLLEADDPALWLNAADEVLRYAAFNDGSARVAREDVMVGDQLVRAGEGVIVATGSANRDESVFSRPGVFDPQRPEARRHLTFNAGIHRCLGEGLAELELRLAFRTLFRRLPTLALAVPVDELRFKPYPYGLYHLPVDW